MRSQFEPEETERENPKASIGSPITIIQHEFLGGGWRYTVLNRQSRCAIEITIGGLGMKPHDYVRAILPLALALGAEWDAFAS